MASNMSDHCAQSVEKSLSSSNVINKTTSETMRLDCDRTSLHLQAGVAGVGQAYQKPKKNSSFQITSITSRLSNDGGEDSADDTEDISDTMDTTSKVTDQETPSLSEEYPKSDEVFGPAPVIPTSSQYGITALVQQTGSGGVMTAMLPQGVTVNVTEGGIALAKADGESDDVNHWQNRFKIVKIDSNEPFKRGRWICLDFMDSPAVTASSTVKKDDTAAVVVSSTTGKEGDIGEQPRTVVQLSVPQQQPPPGQPHTISVPPQYQVPNSTQASTPMMPASQPGQGNVGLQPAPHMSSQPPAQPTLSYPAQMQTPMSQGFTSSQATSSQAQTPPQAQPPLQPPIQQAQVPQAVQTSVPQGVSGTSAPVPGMIPPSTLSQHQPGQSQPSLTSQNIQQQQQQQIPMSQGGLGGQSLQSGVINTMGTQGIAQSVVGHSVTSQPAGVLGQPQPAHVQQQPIPQQSVVQPSTASQQITQSLPSKPMTGSQQQQPQQQIGQVGAAGQLPVTQQMVTGQVGAPTSASVKPSGVAAATHPSTAPAQPQPPGHHSMTAPVTVVQATPAPDQQTPQSQPQQPPTNLEGIPHAQPSDDASNATPPAATGQDDSESTSTASTVAIDNKIEQAMDLVKSHLMFAVREEVEVLKEKITELMERISQLEYENMVLRQYATQEALQQLQQPHHPSNT